MSFAGVAEKRAAAFSREEMIDLWPHVVRQAVIDLEVIDKSVFEDKVDRRRSEWREGGAA